MHDLLGRFGGVFSTATASIALTASALSSPAWAQAAVKATDAAPNEASDDNAAAGEIVVTAQKREQALRKVPISVSVIGGEQVQDRVIVNLQDLAPRLSGVTLATSTSTDILTIRGVGSGSNAGFEQAVATFVDGVYRGRARSSRASLFDMERLEVLKGPQSTYFGNSAIAGAFNVTTRRANPGDRLRYDASAYYSDAYGEYNVQGAASLPITPELAARLALGVSGTSGWYSNVNLGRLEPKRHDLIGRASLAWSPTETFRSDLRYDRGRLRSKGQDPDELTQCPPNTSVGLPARGACAAYLAARGAEADTIADYVGERAETYLNFDYQELALTNRLDLGNYTLTSVTSYYDHDFELRNDLVPVGVLSPKGTKLWADLPTYEEFNQFSQELRIQSPIDRFISFTAGLYYLRNRLKPRQYFQVNFALIGAAIPGYSATTRFATRVMDTRRDEIYSTFAAATINLTSALKVNLGGRYSIVPKSAHRSLVAGLATEDFIGDGAFVPISAGDQVIVNRLLGNDASDFAMPKRTDKAFMPSANVQYDLTDFVSTYISYSRGFKAGGWSFGATANEFSGEHVDAFEAGLKGDVFDRRLFFSLVSFYSRYKDLQEAFNNSLPDGRVIAAVGNAASATTQGIEFNSILRISDALRVSVDGSYVDARYQQFPRAPCNTIQSAANPTVTCTQDLSGRVRAFASKWSGSVTADIRHPINKTLDVRFSPTVYFKSGFYYLTTLDPLSYQKGFAKIDARMSVGPSDGRWEVALVVKNLGNRRTASFINSLVSSPGSSATTLAEPRSVGLQLRIAK